MFETQAKNLRRYSPYDGQHLYTDDIVEYAAAVLAGWTGEGLEWYAPINELSAKTLQPVYHVYNQDNGTHYYTTDKGEYDELVKLGWTGEKIGWCAVRA